VAARRQRPGREEGEWRGGAALEEGRAERWGLGCQRGGKKGLEREGNLGVYSPMAERAGFGRDPAGGGRLRSSFVVAIQLRSSSAIGSESASGG